MMRTMATALLAATAVAATGDVNDSRRQLQAAPCTDLNSDSVVNVSDLLLLLAAFGTSDAGDSNGDGVTDVADLLALLAAFGVPGQCSPGVSAQPITFSPVQFESRNCAYDLTAIATAGYVSPAQLYTDALAAFNACLQPDGYCTRTLQTGIELSNRGVCGTGGDGFYAIGWNGFTAGGGADRNDDIGCPPSRPPACLPCLPRPPKSTTGRALATCITPSTAAGLALHVPPVLLTVALSCAWHAARPTAPPPFRACMLSHVNC